MTDGAGNADDDPIGESLFDGVETAKRDAKSSAEGDAFWYPTVDDIVDIHDDIIAEDEDGQPGIEDEDRIQFAIDYIKHGMLGEKPKTVHEKAFALMRLLASNHWFVDGNKRTALNTTVLFYLFNGYELEYGEDLRAMLKLLAVRETLIDRTVATDYLADQTTTVSWETIGTIAIGSALAALDVESADIDGPSGNPDDEADRDNHNG